MATKHLTFKVEKCVNGTHNGHHCHSPQAIEDYIMETSITGWVIQWNAELEDISSEPYFVSQTAQASTFLGIKQSDRNIVSLARSYMRTYDNWLGFGIRTLSEHFYEVHNVQTRPKLRHEDDIVLLQTDIYLSPHLQKYIRKVYGFSDALSKLGGMLSVLVSTIRVLIGPIAQHMYYVMAIKRLFFARTNDESILKSSKERNADIHIVKYLDHQRYGVKMELDRPLQKEIAKHRLVRLRRTDVILLFLHAYCPCFKYICCWKNRAIVTKLFNEGKMKIEKDLNIIKLVKNLKRLQILMRSSFFNRDVKFQIAHSVYNCINLQEVESECSHGDDHHLHLPPE